MKLPPNPNPVDSWEVARIVGYIGGFVAFWFFTRCREPSNAAPDHSSRRRVVRDAVRPPAWAAFTGDEDADTPDGTVASDEQVNSHTISQGKKMKDRFLTKGFSSEQIEKLRKFDWNRWKLLKIMWFVGWRLAIPLYLFGSLVAWDLLFWNWAIWLRFTVIAVWIALAIVATILLSLVIGIAQQEAKTLCPQSDE